VALRGVYEPQENLRRLYLIHMSLLVLRPHSGIRTMRARRTPTGAPRAPPARLRTSIWKEVLHHTVTPARRLKPLPVLTFSEILLP
jgi:hypothetical protein